MQNQDMKVTFIIEDSETVSFVSQSYCVVLWPKNICGSFFILPQIHTEEHGAGDQAGVEAGAGAEPGECAAEGQPTWVNSLVGRIFWDFLREKYWADQVAHKIQKKLSKIKVKVDEDVYRLVCLFFTD